MIKTVIFDIDGTLFDYDDCHEKSMAVLKRYCVDNGIMPEDQFAEIYRQADKIAVDRIGCTCAAIHNRMIRFQCIMELCKKPLFPHVQAMYDAYWGSMLTLMKPYPGLIEWMESLKDKGIRIGIGSNMTAYMQYKKLEALGVGGYLEWIVTSEETGTEKPDLKFFQQCIAKSGCLPEECLFVGDSLTADIEGAKRAGMKTLLLAPGSEGDGVISSYCDVAEINHLVG